VADRADARGLHRAAPAHRRGRPAAGNRRGGRRGHRRALAGLGPRPRARGPGPGGACATGVGADARAGGVAGTDVNNRIERGNAGEEGAAGRVRCDSWDDTRRRRMRRSSVVAAVLLFGGLAVAVGGLAMYKVRQIEASQSVEAYEPAETVE